VSRRILVVAAIWIGTITFLHLWLNPHALNGALAQDGNLPAPPAKVILRQLPLRFD
jgi:hypothetical protein